MEGRFNGRFLRHRFGGLIFGGTYTWRGLFSEFYGSVLIEQGILVLPHSRTPTVDVRISFANRTTWGAAGAVFFSQIFSGPAILQSSRLFRPWLAVYSGFEPATSDMFVWSKGKSTLRPCSCEIHPISAIYYNKRE